MRYFRPIEAFLLIAVILTVPARDVLARSSYLNTFNSSYGTQGSRLDDCGLCHLDSRGGGSGNGYYQDWVRAGGTGNASAAFTAIEDQDSDGDGTGNLAEIDALFHPGYSCDDYGDARNAPANLVDYVDPNNIGCSTSAGPQIDVSPLALDFGSLELGSSADRIVHVRNLGDAALTVISATLIPAAEFDAVGPVGPLVLDPGAEQQWTLSYAPTNEGADSGSFEIVSDDPGMPMVTVEVTGTGFVSAPVVLDLDVVGLQVRKRVRLERDPSVEIAVTVKNQSQVGGETRPATLVGIQNGIQVYSETQEVSDEVGGGRTRFSFGPYMAIEAGNLEWTVEIADDDADVDVATATTLVISSIRMSGVNLSSANLAWEILCGVELTGTDLRGADLRGCDLSYATGLASTVGDGSTIYSSSTRLTGTGFDPELAGWTLQKDVVAPSGASFGRVKALYDQH